MTAHQLEFLHKNVLRFCTEEFAFARAKRTFFALEKLRYARHSAKHIEKGNIRSTTVDMRAVDLRVQSEQP